MLFSFYVSSSGSLKVYGKISGKASIYFPFCISGGLLGFTSTLPINLEDSGTIQK